MIKGKIRKVGDEICATCSQLYEGECRAFLMPHDRKEYDYRMKDKGKMACNPDAGWTPGTIGWPSPREDA